MYYKPIYHKNTGKLLAEANTDLWGVNLDEAGLRRADLRGAKLRDANLYEADLREANLYGAYLQGANLQGANLHGTNLDGADLDGADLREARNFVDAGYDRRRYQFVAVSQKDTPFRIKAGCRWFSYDEAIAHWSDKNNKDALLRCAVIANYFSENPPK